MTRARMLAEMDAAEMVEWEALYTLIEPMPRGDGGLSALFGSGPAKKPQQSIEEMKEVWKTAVAQSEKILGKS